MEFSHEGFSKHLGQTFRADLGDGATVDLELVEATRMTAPDGGERPDHAFSIVFEGPAEPALEQQIYQLAHPELGSMDIFLVPIAAGEAGYSYEAVFTRVE